VGRAVIVQGESLLLLRCEALPTYSDNLVTVRVDDTDPIDPYLSCAFNGAVTGEDDTVLVYDDRARETDLLYRFLNPTVRPLGAPAGVPRVERQVPDMFDLCHLPLPHSDLDGSLVDAPRRGRDPVRHPVGPPCHAAGEPDDGRRAIVVFRVYVQAARL